MAHQYNLRSTSNDVDNRELSDEENAVGDLAILESSLVSTTPSVEETSPPSPHNTVDMSDSAVVSPSQIDPVSPSPPLDIGRTDLGQSQSATLLDDSTSSSQSDVLGQILRALTNLQLATNAQSLLQTEQHENLRNKIESQSATMQTELQQLRQVVSQETKELLRQSEQRVTDQINNFQKANALAISSLQETLLHLCRDQTDSALSDHQKVIDHQLNKVNEGQNTQARELQNLSSLVKQQDIKLVECMSVLNTDISTVQTQVKDLTLSTDQLQNKMADLQNAKPCLTSTTPEMIVYCEGTSHHADLAPPIFDPRHHNPYIFMQHFEKYWKGVSSKKHNQHLKITDVLLSCLKGESHAWLLIHQEDINDLDSLRNVFYSRFWSMDVQAQLRRKIETSKYMPNGRYTRTRFFLAHVADLRTLTCPKLEEEQIVTILADTFGGEIATAARVMDISTVDRLESLLLRLDRAEITDHNNSRHDKPTREASRAQQQAHNLPRTPVRTDTERCDVPLPLRRASQQYYRTTRNPDVTPIHSSDHPSHKRPAYTAPHRRDGYQPYQRQRQDYPRTYEEVNYVNSEYRRNYQQRPAKNMQHRQDDETDFRPTNEQKRITDDLATANRGAHACSGNDERHLN